MKNVIRFLSCLLVVALVSSMIPADLKQSIALAETTTETGPTTTEYDVKVGSGYLRHYTDDTWEVIEQLPEGAEMVGGTLVLTNVEINDCIEASGPLTISLSGENGAIMINSGDDVTITGPGSLSLRGDLLGFGISSQGSVTLDGCSITVSAEDPKSAAGGIWARDGLTISNSNVYLNHTGNTEPNVYVASGYVLIEDSEVIMNSPDAEGFGLMAMAEDMGDMLEDDLLIVRNSTLSISCNSVAIYPRGNIRVENSNVSLTTTCDLDSFTGFNSFDSPERYAVVLTDSNLNASHEMGDRTGIALGFYNSTVSVDNCHIVSRGSICARSINATDTAFDIDIDQLQTGGSAFEITDEAFFSGCSMSINAVRAAGLRDTYGVHFDDCTLDIQADGNGVLVDRGSLIMAHSDANIQSSQAALAAYEYSSITLLGSNANLFGKAGIYGAKADLALLGGNIQIDSSEAAIAVESYHADPTDVISLGTATVVEGEAKLETTDQRPLYLHTFGNGSNMYWGDWDSSLPYDQFTIRAENAAKTLHLHGNGAFEGRISASETRLSAGTLVNFTVPYISGADETELVFELPDNLRLIPDGITAGEGTADISSDGNKLTVSKAMPTGTVHFSAYAIGEGTAKVCGNAKLRNGDTYSETEMPSCNLAVESFSLGLPTATSRKTLNVNGHAIPDSDILFYDNGVEAGSAHANLAGRFAGEITLSGNGRDHTISARVIDRNGHAIYAASQSLLYDAETVEAETITMTNLIHGTRDGEIIEEVTVLHYGNGQTSAPSYAFWPQYPEISYEVSFTNCNDPLGMGTVYLITTDHFGQESRVYLSYDLERDVWVGSGTYDEYTIPEQISVAYTSNNYGTVQLTDSESGEESIVLFRPMADGSIQFGEDEEAVFVKFDALSIILTDIHGNTMALVKNGDNEIGVLVNGEPFATIAVKDDSLSYSFENGKSFTIFYGEEYVSLKTNDGELLIYEDGSYTFRDRAAAETLYRMVGDDGVKVTYADGSQELYRYGENGQLISSTSRDGMTSTYEYNAIGDLVQVVQEGMIVYAMEEINNTLNMTDTAGEVTKMVFDDQDRLTYLYYPDGLSVSFAYDEYDQLVEMVDPFGNVTSYVYNETGELLGVYNNGEIIAEYTRGTDGVLLAKRTADGTYTEYSYDKLGRLTTLNNKGAALSSFNYAYNEDDLIISMKDNDGEWNYTYDRRGQLTGVTAPDGTNTVYGYTDAGTRANMSSGSSIVTYSSNDLGQITMADDIIYEYDVNGCLSKRITLEGTTEYEWDDGALTRMLLPDGSEYIYTYDVFGNRSSVTVNGETTRYLWIPSVLSQIIGEIRPDGSYVQYVLGDGLEAQIEGGQTRFYQFNALGSTVSMTDDHGNLLNEYHYNADGTLAARLEQVQNPFAYVGQYGIITDENGLWYMRARYILQEVNSFISPDPAGLEYDLNVYRYNNNNSISNVDLTGEKYQSLTRLPSYRKLPQPRNKGNVKITPPHNRKDRTNFRDPTWRNEKYKEVQYNVEYKRNQGHDITSDSIESFINTESFVNSEVFGNVVFDILEPLVSIPKAAYEFWLGLHDYDYRKELWQIIKDIAFDFIKDYSIDFFWDWLYGLNIYTRALRFGWNTGIFITDLTGIEFGSWIWPVFQPFVEHYFNNKYKVYELTEKEQETYDRLKWDYTIEHPDFPAPRYKAPVRYIDGRIDPSGYVYETVPANRIQGITATLYYKAELETPDEEAVVWDAAAYDQINPQWTDWNGEYGWMVGVGWYKVVYEKDGYLTAESDWMPVPPVQTEVNIPMISFEAPSLEKVLAYDSDTVELRFNHYIQAESIGDHMILRREDGTEIGCEIVCLDEAISAEGTPVGSWFRIWCWEDLTVGETLSLDASGVVGANGMIPDDEETQVKVITTVGHIEAEGPQIILAGDTDELRFSVLNPDGEPLPGIELTIACPGTSLAVDAQTVITNEDGWANVSVMGIKPGSGVLLVAEEGGVSASVMLQVAAQSEIPKVYSDACNQARVWLENLRATWTDGHREDEAIAEAYVNAFVDASNSLREIMTADEAMQNLARLDEWDAKMHELIFSRINGHFTSEEYNEIASILGARSRMYLLYSD